MNHASRQSILSRRPPAFSLVEMMIAIAILGVGLTMVATIFPVALAQHRDSTEVAAAITFAQQARATLEARFDKSTMAGADNIRGTTDDIDLVWRPSADPNLTGTNAPLAGAPDDTPVPWMILPYPNLLVGDFQAVKWSAFAMVPPTVARASQMYGNLLSNIPPNTIPPAPNGEVNNPVFFGPGDIVSDDVTPATDAAAEQVVSRLVWIPFCREMPDRSYAFAAVVCRQVRGQVFVPQRASGGITQADPASFPQMERRTAQFWRLPFVWRVRVWRKFTNPSERRKLSSTAGITIGKLAPAGSKIMVTGWVSVTLPPVGSPPPKPRVPAGRILTVAAVSSNYQDIEIVEDIRDLPLGNEAGAPGFDVYVVPPNVVDVNASNPFSEKTPVLEWMLY